jgi:hypothetical protein
VRQIFVLFVILAIIFFGWLVWKNLPAHQQQAVMSAPIIEKQPVVFTQRTFDPQNPPQDMPPMSPGELAVCDSNFLSVANVTGNSRQNDATDALVTVSQVKVTLKLNITIWVPNDATQHILEHEQGHREISEFFYQTADKIAEQIAAKYLGRQVQVSGADLNSAIDKALQQMGAEITQEYDKELNPEPAQERYESITNHGGNDVDAKDAVSQVLSNLTVSPTAPATIPKN